MTTYDIIALISQLQRTVSTNFESEFLYPTEDDRIFAAKKAILEAAEKITLENKQVKR